MQANYQLMSYYAYSLPHAPTVHTSGTGVATGHWNRFVPQYYPSHDMIGSQEYIKREQV